MCDKQRASLLLASRPREGRRDGGSRDGLCVRSGVGTSSACGGGWGEAPARRLGTRWTHPAIRAAPGEGRGGAQGVSAEGHTHCCRTAGRVLTLRLMTTQRWRQARRPTLGERWEQDHCGCSVLTNTGCMGLQGLPEASAVCGRQRAEQTHARGWLCLKGPCEVLVGAAWHCLPPVP